jgi:hypothetical protein
MTKPIPDKAEIALEYPEKLYTGTFERSPPTPRWVKLGIHYADRTDHRSARHRAQHRRAQWAEPHHVARL